MKNTIFAWSDAVATIYFITWFCVPSIWEWCLLNSVSSVKSFGNVRALRKTIRLKKNYDVVPWFWSKPSSFLISCCFGTKRYPHSTSSLFPHFFFQWLHTLIALRVSKMANYCTYFYIAIWVTRFVHVRHASLQEWWLFRSARPEMWWKFERDD